MVAVAQVEIALHPWLGTPLSRALFPVMVKIAAKLNAYTGIAPPDELASWLDSTLFLAVRKATAGSMLAALPDGTAVRIRLEDFAVMADELLFLVFAAFPPDEHHYLLLREYSMHSSSLSALRALYTRFAAWQTDEELRAIAAVAKSCHPAFRLRGWLE